MAVVVQNLKVLVIFFTQNTQTNPNHSFSRHRFWLFSETTLEKLFGAILKSQSRKLLNFEQIAIFLRY